MKKSFLSALALFISCIGLCAAGQDGLVFKGRVTDLQGNPVAYATVAITDASGSVISGATSGEDGSWQIISPKGFAVSDSLVFLCSFIEIGRAHV